MKKVSYRTSMPFDGGLSPLTDRSRAVPLFGDTPLIQDIMNGEVSKITDVRSRGEWAWGRDKDVDKSYREQGDEFMMDDKLLQLDKQRAVQKMDSDRQWVVEFEDGTTMSFPDKETAIRKLEEIKKPYTRIFQKTAQAATDTGPEKVAKGLNSSVMVETTGEGGVREVGAGFCLGQGIFITCAHVVKRYNKQNLPQGATGVSGIAIKKLSESHPAEMVRIDFSKDIAVLRSRFPAEPLKLGDSKDYLVGDEVFVIGCPRGFEDNVSDGIVSSKDRRIFWHEGAPEYIFTDAHVLPGNSGGPMIAYSTGEVVGMMAMIIGADAGLYGLNAAIPAEEIRRVLKEAGISL